MNRYVWLVMLLPGVVFAAEPRKVALLVGVGDYKHHASDKQLGHPPVNDVVEMGKLLKKQGFTTTVLTDADATRLAVLKTFRRLLNGQLKDGDTPNALGRNDVFYLQLNGHGIEFTATIPDDAKDPDRKNKILQPFFQTYDGKPSETDTMIPFNLLLREIGENRVRAAIVVDACREDPDPNTRGTRSGITKNSVTLPDGVSILFSCQTGELANQDLPTQKDGHGLLTRSLLAALRGDTGLADEVSWDQAVASVKKQFRKDERILATLKAAGKPQTPDSLTGSNTGDLILAVVGKAVVNAAYDLTGGKRFFHEGANGEVRLLTLFYDPGTKRYEVHVVDKAGKQRHTLKHASYVQHAAFGPDGKSIVTTSGEKTACVWDAATGKSISSYTAN